MKWMNVGVLAVVFLSVIEAAPTALEEENSLRLPTTSVPTRYHVKLSFSVSGSRTVTGSVTIYIDIVENTDTITLHSKGLAISSLKLASNPGDEIAQTYDFEPEKDFLHIFASRELLAGEKVVLDISYTGQLQTNLLGIYRSTYKVGTATR